MAAMAPSTRKLLRSTAFMTNMNTHVAIDIVWPRAHPERPNDVEP